MFYSGICSKSLVICVLLVGHKGVEILPTRLVADNGMADRMLWTTLLAVAVPPLPLWHEDSIMV